MPIISGSASVVRSTLPGYEIGYAQITASVNITDTSEATATALISSGAITFDGALVVADFYAPLFSSPTLAAGNTTTLTLFEGATEITRLAIVACQVSGIGHGVPFAASYRFTPTAGAHTYKVCGFVTNTNGTPQLVAGAGGTNAYAPAFIRFTKV